MKKEIQDVVACVVDYGAFLSLADRLGQEYSKVFYYAPFESEFRDVKRCCVGMGVPTIERIESPLEVLGQVDLFVFPDAGFQHLQQHLESIGKPVWGSKNATELELYRTQFLDVIKSVGLEVPRSKTVHGISALKAVLQAESDLWIKIDEFRANMETWHHIDYEHSLPIVHFLEAEFGGFGEQVTFVVQYPIPDAEEVGYDGFTVDGNFPSKSFQGYEKKNELYLGSWLENDEMPEMVQQVNEAFSSVLASMRYRNFFATEIRNEFFIDPTTRMAGQTQEHLTNTCANLAEIIWHGANGELMEPVFNAKFAASATVHYESGPPNETGWRVVTIPNEVKDWFKLARYYQDGDTYHFPPGENDELGVVVGNGDTVEEAIEAVKEHIEAIKGEPIHTEVAGFAVLLSDIEEAQAAGNKFSDKPLPPKTVALEK